MVDIRERKQKHLSFSINKNVQSEVGNGFEDVSLIHRSLPEIDMEEISMKTMLFGKKLDFPLIISALTGGTEYAKKINETLASVAEELGLGIGVGSQRIAIQDPEQEHTFRIVRDKAPSTFIMGNLGCPQISMGWGLKEARRCIDMIDADALSIHMNPLQEVIQVGGETKYRGVLKKIGEIASKLEVPIVMKETGCGIAYEEAVKLEKAGVKGLEVSGVGGTSWAAVEHYIAKEKKLRKREELGRAFWNWGIPTAISLIETRKSTGLKIIASGGIRMGIEMAKAMILGADAVGMAKPFLEKAVKGPDALRTHVERILLEFKTVMFLMGTKNIEEMRRLPVVIRGQTAEWLKLRGFNLADFTSPRREKTFQA
jgi:isopentenyl-diphosphate delta-isomerase